MTNLEEIKFKIESDHRGWVAWPFVKYLADEHSLNNIHIPSLNPSAVRGNHSHTSSTEYVLITSGPCRAAFYDNKSEEKLEFIINKELPRLFKIGPGITHAFKNEGDTEIILICFEEKTDPSKDQELNRFVLIDQT